METLNFIATIIGYIVMLVMALIILLMVFAALGRGHAERNRRIYEAEERRRFIENMKKIYRENI